MKVLLCLLAFSIPALAQLRLVGTNALDFSIVQRAIIQPVVPEWTQRYVASGIVEKVERGAVTLVQRQTKYEFDQDGFAARDTVQFGNGSDMLGMLAAVKLGQNGPIGLGQYLSFSPNMRQYFRPVIIETRTEVRNADAGLKVGQSVRLVGWPVSLTVFECGTPVVGNPPPGTPVLIIGPNGWTRRPLQPAP